MFCPFVRTHALSFGTDRRPCQQRSASAEPRQRWGAAPKQSHIYLVLLAHESNVYNFAACYNQMFILVQSNNYRKSVKFAAIGLPLEFSQKRLLCFSRLCRDIL